MFRRKTAFFLNIDQIPNVPAIPLHRKRSMPTHSQTTWSLHLDKAGLALAIQNEYHLPLDKSVWRPVVGARL